MKETKTKSILDSFDLSTVDYKDIQVLKNFVNPYGRITSRRRSNISAKHQRQVASAIKRARFMGLLPYIAK